MSLLYSYAESEVSTLTGFEKKNNVLPINILEFKFFRVKQYFVVVILYICLVLMQMCYGI